MSHRKHTARMLRHKVATAAIATAVAVGLASVYFLIDTARNELSAAREDARQLVEQLRDHGVTPTVTPPPAPDRGERGEPGIPGLSIRGPRGFDGEPGRPPNSGEIFSAVAGYLRANPPPPGRDGENGVNGENGQEGEVGEKGDRGPPPTQEEIAAAVAAYLTANPPPPGADGSPPTQEEIDAAVARFFAEHDIYCTPPGPIDRATGEPWRCTANPPAQSSP